MSVTDSHEEKNTFVVDVILPGHEARGAATPLFVRTRKQLIAREQGKCWVTGLTAEDLGAPLEAHHYPIERCFAEAVDWVRFANDCKFGHWGVWAAGFNWDKFLEGATDEQVEVPATASKPAYTAHFKRVVDPYLFVDDMTVNGRLLGKASHTGKDGGVHTVPEPIFYARKFLHEAYKFSQFEIIHHAQE
jgi:hypothetical protein